MITGERILSALRRRVWLPVRRYVAPETVIFLDAMRFRIDLRDNVIARHLFLEGHYEIELQRFFGTLPLHGRTCIDVGANLGLHTVLLGKLVGSHGRVLAFEPELRNCELLEENIARNGLERTVTLLRIAASDKERTLHLQLNSGNFGDHEIVSDSANPRSVQVVTAKPLDSVTDEIPENTVSLIKIDVQGHEGFVLSGMTKTIQRNPDVVIAIEISPAHLAAQGTTATDVVAGFLELGFSGFELGPDRVLPLAPPWAYDLLRQGHHIDLVLCRNRTLLVTAVSRYVGQSLPL